MQVRILGIPWYRPETYARLRAMFEDGEKLHRTYEEWFAAADDLRKRTEADGIRVICVDIDPDEFPGWCRANGTNLSAPARNRFAGLVAWRIATGGRIPNGKRRFPGFADPGCTTC